MKRGSDIKVWCAVIRELARHHGARGYSAPELAARFEIKQETARRYVKHLHDAGLIHVLLWELRGRSTWTAVWAWGSAVDALKPKFTQAQKTKTYRQRKAAREERERLQRAHAA